MPKLKTNATEIPKKRAYRKKKKEEAGSNTRSSEGSMLVGAINYAGRGKKTTQMIISNFKEVKISDGNLHITL